MTGAGDEIAAGDRGRLRASHADREQVINVLKAAFVQGRLAKDEFDAQLGQVFASRTHAELAAVTAGIPAGPSAAQSPRKPARAQSQLPVKVLVAIAIQTVFTAGLWAALLPANIDNDNWAGMLLFTFTFAWLGTLVLNGVVMLESRQEKRPGRQVSPQPTPSA